MNKLAIITHHPYFMLGSKIKTTVSPKEKLKSEIDY